MYIFKMRTGELKEAPSNFNPDNPDFTILEDVNEVLCINKILVKQMKLVVKQKEEIKKIREEHDKIDGDAKEQPKRKKRSKQV